ncbi:hypothetical protein ACTMTI_44660 [Nonomuraea sp. H19]|uniref:hypothetical protein n=1 Tax=Nonomuraea sp. H19 TaxID=3452206 RepID=UPI003F8C2E8B
MARLGDGLVALPADARTREQLEWIGEMGGSSTVWLAVADSAAQEKAVAAEMRRARAAEYQAVIDQAEAAARARPGERSRAVKRLQAELRRIGRRDHFPPAERETAQQAVHALAQAMEGAG